MYLLSDDTESLTGMRLAGVEGKNVKTAEEYENAAKECIGTDIAILLISTPVADMSRQFTDDLKKQNRPLIVEVPDREHLDDSRDSITRYIREAMGIKL